MGALVCRQDFDSQRRYQMPGVIEGDLAKHASDLKFKRRSLFCFALEKVQAYSGHIVKQGALGM